MAPAGEGEKKPKKKKKKGDKGEKGEKAGAGEGGATDSHGLGQAAPSAGVNGMSAVEASTSASSGPVVVTNGSIAPSALQNPSTTQDAGLSASAFNSAAHAGQGGIVFMNPLSPEEAAKIQTRYVKVRNDCLPLRLQRLSILVCVGVGSHHTNSRSASSTRYRRGADVHGSTGSWCYPSLAE